jgi:hypothetical protein
VATTKQPKEYKDVDVTRKVEVEKLNPCKGSLQVVATPKTVTVFATMQPTSAKPARIKLTMPWGAIYAIAKNANQEE